MQIECIYHPGHRRQLRLGRGVRRHACAARCRHHRCRPGSAARQHRFEEFSESRAIHTDRRHQRSRCALRHRGRRRTFRTAARRGHLRGRAARRTRAGSRTASRRWRTFRRVIDINLTGTFNTVRLAAEAIARSEPQEDGLRGVVVMTSSVSAFEGQIGQAAYAASKGGVASLTLPLARELGQHGIRVVSIAPGVFDTPMMQAAPEKVRQSLIDQIPFPHRLGQADEFASLVCHVFENNMLNGCVLRLDGALRMGPK